MNRDILKFLWALQNHFECRAGLQCDGKCTEEIFHECAERRRSYSLRADTRDIQFSLLLTAVFLVPVALDGLYSVVLVPLNFPSFGLVCAITE
jgi:hypothetical protein